MAWMPPLHLLGTRVNGDVSGLTIYTRKTGRKVGYRKAPPDKPASPAQRDQRDRFQLVSDQWRLLTAAQQQAWKDLANKAHCVPHGYNLFIHAALTADFTAIETLEQQTGITVVKPNYIANPTANVMTCCEIKHSVG